MEIRLIQTQKVLSPTQISLADYVINPYRGCEFGCLYCYSRENKNVNLKEFNSKIGVKINAPEILKKELKYTSPKRVLLGSTTECFQYAELKYGLTEKILQILNNDNIPYTILTKSHLIRRDLSLISRNKKNKIYFTLNCSEDKIISLLEEKSPGLDKRLQAIEEIINKGIDLRVHIGPFIPYVSDIKKILKIIPPDTKEADIELYHNKMGNFKEILKRIDTGIGQKLQHLYSNEGNYLDFAETLKKQIIDCGRQKNIKLFYIIPDFNEFYNGKINYENPLF